MISLPIFKNKPMKIYSHSVKLSSLEMPMSFILPQKLLAYLGVVGYILYA
jgi:hypothetical protein